jgi:ribose transport system permease protein
VALCVFLSLDQPFFYSKDNILNILTTNSALMIAAFGMTVAMISGGFDLSVGAIVAATGLVVERALSHGIPTWISLLLGLALGAAIGASVNGFLIAKLKLNFFVVTLGTMTAIAGFVYVITNGNTYLVTNHVVYEIGNGTVIGVPVPVIITAVCFIACLGFLRWTPLGRNVYVVGSSEEAARLSGIRVAALVIFVYGLSGLFAAVAGIVDAGLIGAAAPDVGNDLALSAGAAVLLGGTSFTGGVGGVTGTLIGVLLVSVLANGLGILGVSSYWQNVVTGGVLIAAVTFDKFHRLSRRRPGVLRARLRSGSGVETELAVGDRLDAELEE